MSLSVNQVEVRTSSGTTKQLNDYKGKVLLIVNVASRCGFTKQYEGLQKLQDSYGKQGFQVLAFPCNDFGGQEPGTLDEIQVFCQSNFNVTFPIFEKVHAKGTTTEPYTTLNKAEPSGDVDWNFEKFLIGKTGNVLGRYKSAIEPENPALREAIESALSE